jgi:hypothetical protein
MPRNCLKTATKSKNMDKHKREDAPLKVYKPNSLIYLIFAMVAIIWLILTCFPLLLGISLDMAAGIIFLIIPLGIGFLGVQVFINLTKESLAIYEDGLEYCNSEKIIFSSWKDLACLGVKGGVCGIYAMTLTKKHDGESFLVEGEFFFPLNLVNISYRIEGCWGKTVVDTAKFAETKFGRELLHYAPQLFENGKEKQKHG